MTFRELSEIEALLFVLEKEYNQFLIQSANVADLVKKVFADCDCDCECNEVDGECEETIYHVERETGGKEPEKRKSPMYLMCLGCYLIVMVSMDDVFANILDDPFQDHSTKFSK